LPNQPHGNAGTKKTNGRYFEEINIIEEIRFSESKCEEKLIVAAIKAIGKRRARGDSPKYHIEDLIPHK
jgi:hypothetical protein